MQQILPLAPGVPAHQLHDKHESRNELQLPNTRPAVGPSELAQLNLDTSDRLGEAGKIATEAQFIALEPILRIVPCSIMDISLFSNVLLLRSGANS